MWKNAPPLAIHEARKSLKLHICIARRLSYNFACYRNIGDLREIMKVQLDLEEFKFIFLDEFPQKKFAFLLNFIIIIVLIRKSANLAAYCLSLKWNSLMANQIIETSF